MAFAQNLSQRRYKHQQNQKALESVSLHRLIGLHLAKSNETLTWHAKYAMPSSMLAHQSELQPFLGRFGESFR